MSISSLWPKSTPGAGSKNPSRMEPTGFAYSTMPPMARNRLLVPGCKIIRGRWGSSGILAGASVWPCSNGGCVNGSIAIAICNKSGRSKRAPCNVILVLSLDNVPIVLEFDALPSRSSFPSRWMLTDLPSASIMTPEAAILVGESFPFLPPAPLARKTGTYSTVRGWLKIKNPNYTQSERRRELFETFKAKQTKQPQLPPIPKKPPQRSLPNRAYRKLVPR